MNCPQCGTVLTEDAKFCGTCGFNLASQPQNTSDTMEQSTDALLAEMFPTITETDDNRKVLLEKTEKIQQEDNSRLFLDDEEDETVDNSDEFFSNLISLNENDEMLAENTGDFFKPSFERKISPVFEEIPDFNQQINDTVSDTNNYEELESDEDDYSDIVIGNSTSDVPIGSHDQQVVSETQNPQNSTENQQTKDLNSVNDFINNAMPTNKIHEAQQQEQATVVPPIDISKENPTTTELPQNLENQSANGTFLLIENASSPTENNMFGEYNVNINDKNQTPYLDKFIPHKDANVNFEIPANDIQEQQPIESCLTEQQNQNTVFQSEDMMQAPAQPQIISEQPMVTKTEKEKKKSKVPLIITLTIVGLLIISVITCGFLFKDNIISLFSDNTPQQEEVFNDETSEINKNETQENKKPIDQNPNWDLLTSSLEAPLTVGQASKVSKYIDDTKAYSDVQMSVTKIHRGENALKLAKDYEKVSPVVFEEPQQGIEYVVVEYEVYLPAETNTNGTTANIPLEVRGLSTNGIVFNNSSYVISTWCIDKGENSKTGNKITCKEIFQMPIGCTDYYLVFGTNGYTTTVFKGQ